MKNVSLKSILLTASFLLIHTDFSVYSTLNTINELFGLMRLIYCATHIELISYKRYFQCTIFNDDYLSIPEHPGSQEYLFHEIPEIKVVKKHIFYMIRLIESQSVNPECILNKWQLRDHFTSFAFKFWICPRFSIWLKWRKSIF